MVDQTRLLQHTRTQNDPVWYLCNQSLRFKKFGKIRLGANLPLGFIYDLSFRILFSIYLADFHGRNWHILGFYDNKTQHWALFSTKTNQGRFYFYSLSQAEDHAAINHVTQAVEDCVYKSGLRNYYGSSRSF